MNVPLDWLGEKIMNKDELSGKWHRVLVSIIILRNNKQ